MDKRLLDQIFTLFDNVVKRDAAEKERLLQMLERLSLSLITPARQAVAPIGNTCNTMQFGTAQRR